MGERKIAVIGLGYVGLPLALAFARKFPGTVGFDINTGKVRRLLGGIDETGEGLEAELKSTPLKITDRVEDLKSCNFFIIGVPTPVDKLNRPDLSLVESASRIAGQHLSKGSIVCFESTVYPGVTEDICGPILEQVSGLKSGVDFKLAYSPERINPGDKEHTFERVVKVVSGQDQETLEEVARVYGSVIKAGVFRATSIKVAEAAKVIENTQRDLNIALMNELSMIFDRLGISTREVIEAAATKWNFLRFSPGLVGGHCIGVDPYYLTTKAEELGYRPQVILAGRRINDEMGRYVAQRAVKLMANAGIPIKGARVGVLGLTFKENVPDLRNSRVPDIINELRSFGAQPIVHDPIGDPAHAEEEYQLSLSPLTSFKDLDCIVGAVAHDQYRQLGAKKLQAMLRSDRAVFVDVKAMWLASDFSKPVVYWSL